MDSNFLYYDLRSFFRIRRFLWFINDPLRVAFNVFQENPNEFIIPKGVIHLGES